MEEPEAPGARRACARNPLALEAALHAELRCLKVMLDHRVMRRADVPAYLGHWFRAQHALAAGDPAAVERLHSLEKSAGEKLDRLAV